VMYFRFMSRRHPLPAVKVRRLHAPSINASNQPCEADSLDIDGTLVRVNRRSHEASSATLMQEVLDSGDGRGFRSPWQDDRQIIRELCHRSPTRRACRRDAAEMEEMIVDLLV